MIKVKQLSGALLLFGAAFTTAYSQATANEYVAPLIDSSLTNEEGK
jgi:hypothetical protein